MTRNTALTAASWIAVLTMMAFICFRLADQFSPENMYPKHLYPERYTESAFKSLQYENAQNKVNRIKAERFIRSIAEGNL